MQDSFPLILDVEASALENGFPIEIGLADPMRGIVHAWLIRPYAGWAWDRWDPASQRVPGLFKADLDHGDDVLTVGREAIDLPRIDHVFGEWISRAQAASPWRGAR